MCRQTLSRIVRLLLLLLLLRAGNEDGGSSRPISSHALQATCTGGTPSTSRTTQSFIRWKVLAACQAVYLAHNLRQVCTYEYSS